jgi:hypothetical protein
MDARFTLKNLSSQTITPGLELPTIEKRLLQMQGNISTIEPPSAKMRGNCFQAYNVQALFR